MTSTPLPPSTEAHNGTFAEQPKGYDGPVDTTHTKPYAQDRRTSSGRMTNLILALLLAIVTALSAAPASGYKSGWAYYRRHNFVAPLALLPTGVPFTLQIWVGWIKGSNSLTNILHRLAPNQVPEYVKLSEVEYGGQVAAGLAIAFILVGGFVAFLYFLACIMWSFRGSSRSGTPPGLCIAGIIFGTLNVAWSIVCYIVISVGTAIYTRRTLRVTYVAWPDWCFFLAFFSGVFFWIAAGIACGERRRAKRSYAANGQSPNMTYNTTYEQPNGTAAEAKPAAV